MFVNSESTSTTGAMSKYFDYSIESIKSMSAIYNFNLMFNFQNFANSFSTKIRSSFLHKTVQATVVMAKFKYAHLNHMFILYIRIRKSSCKEYNLMTTVSNCYEAQSKQLFCV